MQEEKLAYRIARILYDKKAQDVSVLRVSHLTVLTDYLVVASGSGALQVRALAEHLDQQLASDGINFRRKEGENEGHWIVMDYASVIVHIFHPEDRDYYRLERLWDDGQNRIALEFDTEELAEKKRA